MRYKEENMGTENCTSDSENNWEGQQEVDKTTNEMQFSFIPGHRTKDVISIFRQLKEKYLARTNNLYFWHLQIWRKILTEIPGMLVGGRHSNQVQKSGYLGCS